MRTFRGIGSMTGTSMDGLDLACCAYTVEGDHYGFKIERTAQVPFDAKWQARLRHLPQQSAETFARTHVYFGHWMGTALHAFIEELDAQPDFVAVHGQTIFHQPDRSFTCQIGDGETIAAYLPCPLVSNFRNKDVALKGEGAPLIVLGEKHLFPGYQLFLNLGGICNLTYRDMAFDIAPCNSVLDWVWRNWVPQAETDYDPDGILASSGELIPELMAQLDRLPYYHRTPPKSLGWEWTEEQVLPLLQPYSEHPANLLHTIVQHITHQVKVALRRLNIMDQPLLITGGGRHHSFLLETLATDLQSQGITIPDPADSEWVDYKEAIVFGFLGLRTLLGLPTTLRSATGADHDVVTGSIHLPPKGGKSWL